MYAKELSEPNYEFLIKKCEDAGIKHFNHPNAFIKYSDTMDDTCEDVDSSNPRGERKTIIGFDDMIADIMTNNKFQTITKELLIRCR